MAKNKKRRRAGNNIQAPQATEATQEGQTAQKSQAPRRPRLFGDPGWRDRPFVKRKVSLCSPEAKSLGNRIPSIASAACIIGFALQRWVEDIRVLALLEAVDEEVFQSLGKDLENECARLGTLIAEEGVQKNQNFFPHPVTVEAEITHPYGVEYAKMVENMDRLVMMLWDLHSARIINSLELKKSTAKWYDLIYEAGRRISDLAYNNLNEARQEEALKDQKDAAEAQEEAAGAAVAGAQAEVASPAVETSGETKEPASPETPQPPETLHGGNGRKPRKAGKTTCQDSEAEDIGKGSGHETSMLGLVKIRLRRWNRPCNETSGGPGNVS